MNASLDSEMKQRSAKSDAALRDAVTRATHVKGFAESLASQTAPVLAPALQAELRKTVGGVLVPAIENALQNVCVQTAEKINAGVQEMETKINVSVTR